MPEDYPESLHVAAGLGYPDEQRTASLDASAMLLGDLRKVEPWRLTPYTERVLQVERLLSDLVSTVASSIPDEDDLTSEPLHVDLVDQADRVSLAAENLRGTGAHLDIADDLSIAAARLRARGAGTGGAS